MKIVVLTSKENFIWHSMQEIIPYIEYSWEQMPQDQFSVVKLNIDSLPYSELIKEILTASCIVMTCFNYKIITFLKTVRLTLEIKIPWIIYVHNMSTIAFWPFRYFGAEHLLQTNDHFITSCENDLQTLKSIFIHPQATVIPFSKINLQHTLKIKKPKKEFNSLVYVGRISPQKNLHQLFLAYFLVNKLIPLPPLVLFGKEDHLGCPNMGIENHNYYSQLLNLSRALNLEKNIIFKGHVDRNEIENYLSSEYHLCVSPSLHSDENFGMAIFTSLILNNFALISNWGGHADFKKKFFNQVELLPINNSALGPTLSANTIAQHLLHILKQQNKNVDHLNYEISIDLFYTLNFALNKQQQVIKSLSPAFSQLQYSQLANKIFGKKTSLNSISTEKQKLKNSNMQIFESFADSNFNKISTHYTDKFSVPCLNHSVAYVGVPWLTYNSLTDEFLVDDPHKGPQIFINRSQSKNKFILIFNSTLLVYLSQELHQTLFENGYLFTDVVSAEM